MKQFFTILLTLMLFSCGKKQAAPETVSPEEPSLDGVCGYLTTHEIEEALGVTLTEPPAEINEESLGGRGCSYSGANENSDAHFGYIIFTTAIEYEKAKSGEATSGVGEEAYTVNGPDAQQLWVREGNNFIMIAIGDVPQPEASKKLAALVLKRLKKKPLVN
jgi:hypothetical protein